MSWFSKVTPEEVDTKDALKICYAIFAEKFLVGSEGKRPMSKVL